MQLLVEGVVYNDDQECMNGNLCLLEYIPWWSILLVDGVLCIMLSIYKASWYPVYTPSGSG